MSAHHRPFHNLLLNAVSDAARARLDSKLERVSLESRQTLETPGIPIEYAYFFETALASTVARSGEQGSEVIEVGVSGYEGVSAVAVIQHADFSPFSTFIQIPGEALRISTADLRSAMDDSKDLSRILLRFSQCNMVQIGYTALANGRYSVLERMARWILMCHDRVPGDRLELTHEFLSLMLGVRRAGITTDMHVLEGEHAVINKRGRVIVRERAKLEDIAGESYGGPEAEYARLIGLPLRRGAESATA
jgi:CRP-like cAMP-binding protein